MLDIAQLILSKTTALSSHLQATGQPRPSFTDGSPALGLQLTPALEAERELLLSAVEELRDLLLGPTALLKERGESHCNLISLQFVYRYDVINNVNENGITPYTVIAERIKLPEATVQRMLQHASVRHRIFQEAVDEKGALGVIHNATSRALRNDYNLQCFIGVATEELWPAAVKAVDALDKWGTSEEPNQAGFNLANNTTDSMYVHFGKHPVRAKRFADTMSAYSTRPSYSPRYILSSFPWHTLPAGATIVDEGGSLGSATIPIIEQFPQLKLVVQDIPEVVQNAVPQKNVEFMAHDIFTKQPVTGADVYFLRFIFHNWSDTYSEKILKSLIPALKPGAKVLACEYCIPALSDYHQYPQRVNEGLIMDMIQLEIQNGRERSERQWKTVFETADPRFKFNGVHTSEGSAMSIIEATWSG